MAEEARDQIAELVGRGEELERALDEIALVLNDVLRAEDAEAAGRTEQHNELQQKARKRLAKILVQRGLAVGSVPHLTEG